MASFNLDFFQCPLTMEVLQDTQSSTNIIVEVPVEVKQYVQVDVPVDVTVEVAESKVQTTETYEKRVALGNRTSPLTGEELSITNLVPNLGPNLPSTSRLTFAQPK